MAITYHMYVKIKFWRGKERVQRTLLIKVKERGNKISQETKAERV